MELTGLKELIAATGGEMNGSSFVGVMRRDARFDDIDLSGLSFNDCNIAGPRVDGFLVSEPIAAWREKQ